MHARRVITVVVRQLPQATRKSNREPAGRVVVTEEGFSDRLPAKLARIPGFEDSGNMFLRPTNRQGPSVLKNQNYRLARGGNSFKQLFLIVRQVKRRAVETLARGALPFTQRHNYRVGGLGGSHSSGNVFAC